MEKIKRILKKIMPRRLLEALRCMKSSEYRKIRDHKVCFGNKNPDKKYYVFRGDQDNWGLYTFVFCSFISRLKVILQNGYIPVFDMQNYRPKMMEDKQSLNLWDRYFGDYPGKPKLSEVYTSQNVILGLMNSTQYRLNMDTVEGFAKINTPEMRNLFNTYMSPSIEVKDKSDVLYDELFPKKERILGVAIRECYRYVTSKYKDGSYDGHPAVMPFEEQVKQIENYMKKWNCQKLFLMVDDRECLVKMQNYFKDRLIHHEHPLMHYFENGEIVTDTALACRELSDNAGERLINYLVEVELLARCDCMVSSVSSAVEAAILRNDGKYDHYELIDTGVY